MDRTYRGVHELAKISLLAKRGSSKNKLWFTTVSRLNYQALKGNVVTLTLLLILLTSACSVAPRATNVSPTFEPTKTALPPMPTPTRGIPKTIPIDISDFQIARSENVNQKLDIMTLPEAEWVHNIGDFQTENGANVFGLMDVIRQELASEGKNPNDYSLQLMSADGWFVLVTSKNGNYPYWSYDVANKKWNNHPDKVDVDSKGTVDYSKNDFNLLPTLNRDEKWVFTVLKGQPIALVEFQGKRIGHFDPATGKVIRNPDFKPPEREIDYSVTDVNSGFVGSVSLNITVVTDSSLNDFGWHRVYLNDEPNDEFNDFVSDSGERAATSVLEAFAKGYYMAYNNMSPGRLTYKQFMDLWSQGKTEEISYPGSVNGKPDTIIPGNTRVILVNPAYYKDKMVNSVGSALYDPEGKSFAFKRRTDGVNELWVGIDRVHMGRDKGRTASGGITDAMIWVFKYNQVTGLPEQEFRLNTTNYFGKFFFGSYPANGYQTAFVVE